MNRFIWQRTSSMLGFTIACDDSSDHPKVFLLDETTMSIRFRCPNESCAKNLTVTDDSAGRPGKCPWCGTAVVVPSGSPANPLADTVHKSDSRSVPPPIPVAVLNSKPSSYHEDVWEEDLDVPDGPSGRVLSYGAIGLGWQLLRSEFVTWVLATFVMFVLIAGLGIFLQALMVGLFLAEVYLLGPHPFPFVMPVFFLLNVGIQGWLARASSEWL